MSKEIAISVVRPKDYPHSDCFNPVITCLENALKSAGYKVDVLFNVYIAFKPSIIIGAHLLDKPTELLDLKKATIYNFEQISPESHWITKDYFKTLLAKPYLDYSITNINNAFAIDRGIKAKHLPFAYEVPMDYTYVARDVFRVVRKDIDILFYGSMNDRRLKIIHELADKHGINAKYVFGVYGDELSKMIHRSKLVLNMHYYESSIFEAVRVLPLLASRVPVVSEASVDDEQYDYLENGLVRVPYSELADACKTLLTDSEKRQQVADAGFCNVKRKTMNQVIDRVESFL